MKVPDNVGVPLMVMTLANHDAVTPAGRPVGEPIPVAPVVVCVMDGIASPKHNVGEAEAGEAVFVGVMVMDSAAVLAHKPAVGVKVYVVVIVLLITGVQVPVIGGTLVEESGSAGTTAPAQ